MTGDIAAAGEWVDGMMMARAVEPDHGRRPGAGAGTLCLNCGTRLTGAHCHRCGQSAHVHRTVGAIGHEIAHGVFHFEGKIWRTLPMLAFRPGELTRRYVAGERARFVSPMAIFLFSVFLLFAVVAQLPVWHMGNTDWISDSGVEKARSELVRERSSIERRTVDLRRKIADEQRQAAPDTDDIADWSKELTQLVKAHTDLARTESMLPRAESGQGGHADNWIEAKWAHIKENPQLTLYKIKSSAYKFSWALIPLSLPFLWLLFPLRRDVGMYDHAVFATYSLSFMSLLAITLAVLATTDVLGGWLLFGVFLIPPLHIYKQLKGGYRLSRVGALWRTAWTLIFACVTSSLFVLLLLYLGTSE